MKEPKYKIGHTVFSYFTANAEMRIDGEKINDCIHIPGISVVKEIIINKKEVRYAMDRYLRYDQKIKKHTVILTEKEMDASNSYTTLSLSEHISFLKDLYTNYFNEITKHINKENLSAVLHGE